LHLIDVYHNLEYLCVERQQIVLLLSGEEGRSTPLRDKNQMNEKTGTRKGSGNISKGLSGRPAKLELQ